MMQSRIKLSVAACVLVFSLGCGSPELTVIVENGSRETISIAAVVTSWGNTHQITNIHASETASLKYRAKEGEYHAEITMVSGRKISTEPVYVTPLMDLIDHIVVDDTGATIVRKRPTEK